MESARNYLTKSFKESEAMKVIRVLSVVFIMLAFLTGCSASSDENEREYFQDYHDAKEEYNRQKPVREMQETMDKLDGLFDDLDKNMEKLKENQRLERERDRALNELKEKYPILNTR